MEPSKAIQIIKDLSFRLAKDGLTKQANNMAIQALEKQIPKALTHEATIYACGTCPNCKNVVRERNQTFDYRYCHFCGQKLDGGEDANP